MENPSDHRQWNATGRVHRNASTPLVRCSGPIQDGARPPSLPYIDSALSNCTTASTSAATVSHTFIASIWSYVMPNSGLRSGLCRLPYTPSAIDTSAPAPSGTSR